MVEENPRYIRNLKNAKWAEQEGRFGEALCSLRAARLLTRDEDELVHLDSWIQRLTVSQPQ